MTNTFLNGLIALGRQEMSPQVCQAAKAALMDYLGVELAGARLLADPCRTLREELGDNMQCQALMAGLCAHLIELDDGHRIGMVHVGSPVISALLPVAQKYQVSANDLLRGIVVGYETTIRLACAIQPGHKLRGYHATGTCGTVGAAMAVASMLDFDFTQTQSAFSAAVTSAAGLLEIQEDASELKPYNVGRAAMDGVAAAFMGKTRFKGPDDPLGGKRGFLKVLTDEPKMQYLTDFSGEKRMIETVYMKSYAACRHCHPAIEAALSIRGRQGFSLDAVEEIHVDTYKLAVQGHDHTDIKGANSAKMSIPFSLAVALCKGRAGLDEFSEATASEESVLALTKKVSVSAREDLSALSPQKRVAEVCVKTADGLFRQRVDYPKGEPENPLTPQELEEKFRGLALYGGLTHEDCDSLIGELGKDDFSVKKIIDTICKK